MDDEIMTMSVTENPTEDMRGYIHYEGSNVYVEIYDRKCRENVSETLGSVKEVSGEYDIDKIDFNCHLYCNYQHTGTMPTELTTLRGCMIESVVYRTKKGAFWTAVQRLTACPYDENPSGKKPKVYTRTNYGYNTANAFSATNWSDWKCEDNAIEAEATARAAADTAEATARAAADEELKSDLTDLQTSMGITTETEEGYLDANGVLQQPSAPYYPITTDYIDFAFNSTMEIKTKYEKSSGRLWLAYCLFDKDKNIVGTRKVPVNNESGDGFTYSVKNTDELVKYIRFSFRTNIHATSTTYTLESWAIRLTSVNDYFNYVSNEIIGTQQSDTDLTPSRLFSAFVPRKPRFCFSKGKMWLEHWNTKESYAAAGQDANCSIINGDVQVSADGYFVMYHDDDVSARTDSTGAVMQMNWEDLQEVNITSGVYGSSGWTGKADGSTGKIPLLSDFLDICRRYGKIAFIEVKNSKDISAAKYDEMIDMIKAKGMQESVFVAVANSANTGGINPMKYLSKNYPWLVQTAILSTWSESNISNYIGCKNMNISGYIGAMKEGTDQIDYIRSTGKLVHACANRPQTDQDVKDAVAIGCDIIAVNHPIPTSCL